MTSTLGASSGAFGPGIIDQSPTDSSIVWPIDPPKVRSGMGRTVRSWANLPIASASDDFSSLMPPSSDWATDLAIEPESACSMGKRWSSEAMTMTAAEPLGRFSPILP